MSQQHVFTYVDDQDFISQMTDMIGRLEDGLLEPYATVRARYPHLSTQAFCMRIKRYSRPYPRQMGRKGQRTKALFVTRGLHAHLMAPVTERG